VVARVLRLLSVRSKDLHAVLLGRDADPHEDFAAILSRSTDVHVSWRDAAGWARTLHALRANPPSEADPFDVLLTSAAAELADPSPDPREALIALSKFLQDRNRAHVITLNGSTLIGTAGRDARAGLETTIRRLNLAIMEASHATGLSVLDADRLVAETHLPGKVTGPFEYSSQIRHVLRLSLGSILGALGFADRSVMEVSMPFIRQVATVTIERWSTSEGDDVAVGDVLCQLRLSGVRMLKSPRSASVLASIDHRPPLLERIVTRERVQRRRHDAAATLVAADNGIVRRVVARAGSTIRPGDVLAILSEDGRAAFDPSLTASPFRAVIRTDDPRLEARL
jgi:hypothetical protein